MLVADYMRQSTIRTKSLIGCSDWLDVLDRLITFLVSLRRDCLTLSLLPSIRLMQITLKLRTDQFVGN